MKISADNKVGEYTLISKCRNTISKQTIYDYYDKRKKLRTTVVEKETKDNQGNSVRLIGSTIRHKEGYPPLVFDTGVIKLQNKTHTGFNAFLPSVTEKKHRTIFESYIEEKLTKNKITFCLLKNTKKIPEYLKKLPMQFRRCGFNVQREGKNLGLIEELKGMSFAAYDEVLKLDPSPCSPKKFSDYLINEQSRNEHMIFKGHGMSVPSKVQKAFFTLFSERTEFEGV